MNVSKLAVAKAKKKCCRSKPRCKRCPVVVGKIRKAELKWVPRSAPRSDRAANRGRRVPS